MDDFNDFVAFDDPDDVIPICDFHRGIGLHDHQSPARLKVVRKDTDSAFKLTDVNALYAFCADNMKAPEARIFAKLKLIALWNEAAEKRRARPVVDRQKLEAMTNALDSRIWRSPTHYGSDLDPRPGVLREEPLGPTNERPR
jgi:hypothetical protein